MRILMVLEYRYPPHQRVEKEVRSLLSHGHDVHVLAYPSSSVQGVKDQQSYGRVHAVGVPWLFRRARLLYGGSYWYTYAWKQAILRVVDNIRPDVVHVHDVPLAAASISVAKMSRLPVVLDLHENWPGFLKWAARDYNLLIQAVIDHSGIRRAERNAVRAADRIIVVDPTNAERLAGCYRANPDKMTVVSNTPDLPLFARYAHMQRASATNGQIRLLYVGGVDHGRGLQTVIDAISLARHRHPAIECKILGDGPYLQPLIRQAEAAGVLPHIEFGGWQPYAALLAAMEYADIGLVPHLRDELTDTTIPNKIYEYMAARLAVLASDCVPLRRVVEGARCGLVFRSGDSAQCAEALCELASNEAARQAMGVRGREAVESSYNWMQDERRLLELYSTL